MLRNFTTNASFRSLSKASIGRPASVSSVINRSKGFNSQVSLLSSKRPQLASAPQTSLFTTSSLRYATKGGPPFDKIDTKAELKAAEKKIEPDPASVSGASSVRQVFEPSQRGDQASDMRGGLRGDLDTIKDTFALTHVPREAYLIGGAGVLPYLATSLSTVGLAWEINVAHATGSGYLFSAQTAHQILDFITPLQIGYGAVIISFLGAIHWGLEFAGYGGHHSYRRYAIGVLAPAVAWPTMLMPVEYALITQFLAFNVLYFTDARATVRGWCPPWYSTYRFVLTFVVGASIVASLVGRGQIAEKDQRIAGPVDYLQALRESQWENLEKEEKERRRRIAKEDEEANKDEDDDGEDDGEREGDGGKDKKEGEGKEQKDGGSKDKKQGDSKDKKEGGSGDKKEGDSKDKKQGDSKDKKEGDSKDKKEGDSKDKKEGDSKNKKDEDNKEKKQKDGDNNEKSGDEKASKGGDDKGDKGGDDKKGGKEK